MNELVLCDHDECRLLQGHTGRHDKFPRVWETFFEERDINKINKSGYATPRGGEKNGYQNHVYRNGKVIIPYEKLNDVNLDKYNDGYIIRIYPEQYFIDTNIVNPDFNSGNNSIEIGVNAFILYRSHSSYSRFPPLDGWEVRSLVRSTDGKTVNRRGKNTEDKGEYLLRLSRIGSLKKRYEGVPQGIFAPEYADINTNYLCQCVLAWLTVHTCGSPYTSQQARHIKLILDSENLGNISRLNYKGIMENGFTKCPLCMRYIRYKELHETISFSDETGLINAGNQSEGSTRSTIVNLFHMEPLVYNDLFHIPENMAWGHATCNTRLGQRPCYSLEELKETDLKVAIVQPQNIETFGWISSDYTMIRSPEGAVWIQLHGDIAEKNVPIESVEFSSINNDLDEFNEEE